MQEILVETLDRITGLELSEHYRIPHSPHVRTNMVVSKDGYFVDADGASRHFSSPEDMRIFNLLRSLSDVVLVGAQTAVADNYGQIKIREEFVENRQSPVDVPTIALVSRSLRIPFDLRLFTMQGPRPLIFTTQQNNSDWVTRRNKLEAIAEVIQLDETEDSDPAGLVRVIVNDLHQRDLNRILCEGGPTLLEKMFAADLVTDIAVTVSSQASRFSEPNPHPLPDDYVMTTRISADNQEFLQLRRNE